MPFSQMSAVTGRKVKPGYVEAINAQTPLLPALKAAQQSDLLAKQGLALDEKSLDQNERALTLNQQALTTEEQLARDELEQQEQQAKKANLLSMLNLGTKTGMGVYGEMTDPVKKTISPAISGGSVSGGSVSPGVSDITSGEFGLSATPSFLSKEGAGSLSNWTNAGADWTNLAAGGLGALAAHTLGKDKSTLTKAAIGAGASGLAQAIISSGDPYKSVISGILGGIGGLL